MPKHRSRTARLFPGLKIGEKEESIYPNLEKLHDDLEETSEDTDEETWAQKCEKCPKKNISPKPLVKPSKPPIINFDELCKKKGKG